MKRKIPVDNYEVIVLFQLHTSTIKEKIILNVENTNYFLVRLFYQY